MIDPEKYGVSFSVKQCQNFKISSAKTLTWLLTEMKFRRFRLMSYWNELEKEPGTYDFKELDRQIAAIHKKGGTISLCLGARQPRWPENHWPDWAWKLSKEERTRALLRFIEIVVRRYRTHPAITSWQLENEALLEEFGEKSEVDRNRLNQEFGLVKQLDQTRPTIMTTSTSWGIPFWSPIPDIVGFSLYNIVFNKGRYRRSLYIPFIFRARAFLIRLLHRKASFIHELQLEPWGPKAIWEMSPEEQNKSMSTMQIKQNLRYAAQTKLHPLDLWGGEWWFWRAMQGDTAIADVVKQALS